MAAPSTQRVRADIALALGDNEASMINALNFSELSTVEANQIQKFGKKYAASAVNQTLDLSQFFSSVTWIAVVDKGGTGLLVGTATGTTGRLNVQAGKAVLFANGNSTPPTLYIDNLSSTDSAYVEIIAIGSFT